jgi:hypothetical protein
MFKYLATFSLFNLLISAGLTTVGFPVLSQTTKLESKPNVTSPNSSSSNSSSPNSNSATEDRPVNFSTKLKLTKEQQERAKVSFNAMLKKIVAELTPEQRKKLGDSAKSKAQVLPSLNALNLTADQTKKIKMVIRATNLEIKAMLTPEQLNELKLSQTQKAKK